MGRRSGGGLWGLRGRSEEVGLEWVALGCAGMGRVEG